MERWDEEEKENDKNDACMPMGGGSYVPHDQNGDGVNGFSHRGIGDFLACVDCDLLRHDLEMHSKNPLVEQTLREHLERVHGFMV